MAEGLATSDAVLLIMSTDSGAYSLEKPVV